MQDYLPPVRSSPLFFGMQDDEIEAMLRCLEAKPKKYQKDACILRAGDPSGSVGLLLEGGAWIIQEDFWGNRNIVAEVVPGQLFAEAFACSGAALNVSVFAQTPCRVLFLSVRRILTMCPSACFHHSRVIRNLAADLAEKNLRFSEKLTHMGQRSTRGKLLSYLSAQARRQGSASFDIPFSRQQLADYLSVERSGLSAELCKMRDEGILSFRKNHFTLNVSPQDVHRSGG